MSVSTPKPFFWILSTPYFHFCFLALLLRYSFILMAAVFRSSEKLGWASKATVAESVRSRIRPGGLNLRLFHLQIIVTLSGFLLSPHLKILPSLILLWSLKKKKPTQRNTTTYIFKYMKYVYILLFIIFIVYCLSSSRMYILWSLDVIFCSLIYQKWGIVPVP